MSQLVFILNGADWPVLLVDANAKICHRNPAAEKIFGPQPKEPVLLSTIWAKDNNFTPEKFLSDWERTTHGTTPLEFHPLEGKDSWWVGSLCIFEHDEQDFFLLQLMPPPPDPEAKPAATATAEAIAHKQKLECALQLARTMALDFNNALTSILGHTSLILGKIEPTHEWRASLVEVEKAASKAAEIANDLANFSRQEKEVRTQLSGNLNNLLQRMQETFKTTSPPKIVWKFQPARRLYGAKFDEAKMQQVFAKILENAVQSLGNDASITIQSRNLDLTQPTQDRNVQLAAGSYVCTEITDNGCGIPADVLPRIFEPFFTTKKAPHRGLGLAWVYGVVTNHGGGVAVSSEPGTGTSVRVYLPADKQFIQETSHNTDNLAGTGQQILMVDDEDLLLTMGQAILSAFGFKVLTANSGQKALEILSKGEPEIDLLITDLVMPGMSGRELVEQARRAVPDLRILCTSGYAFPGKNTGETPYLQKPFTSRNLLLKVKEVLADSTDSEEALPAEG